MRRFTVLLAVSGLLFAACSSDDGDSAVSDTTAASTTTLAPTTTTEGVQLPAACIAPFSVEVRLSGDGPRTTFDLVDSVAIRKLGGVVYTVYLADFDMPADTNWQFSVPEVAAGNTLLATGLDYFNVSDVEALEKAVVGDSGSLFGSGSSPDEASTFLSVTSDLAEGFSSNQEGTTTVVAVTDDLVCLRVEITGESGLELVGTFAAPIVTDF